MRRADGWNAVCDVRWLLQRAGKDRARSKFEGARLVCGGVMAMVHRVPHTKVEGHIVQGVQLLIGQAN